MFAAIIIERHSVPNNNTVIPYWWMHNFAISNNNRSAALDQYEYTTRPYDMNNTTTAIDDDDSSRETINSSSTEDWTIPDVANDTLTDDEDDGGGGGSAKNLSDNFELGSETRTNTELKNDLDIEPFEQSPKITTKTAVTTTAAVTTTTPFYEEIRLTESSLSDKNVTSEGQSFLPTKSVKDLGSSLLNETSLLKHSMNVKGVTETTTKIYEEIRLTDSRVAAASEATPVDQDLHFNVIMTNKNDVHGNTANRDSSQFELLVDPSQL